MKFLIKNKCHIRQQDNLEMMKDLKSESIDLIYCDILYNTGKKFKDYEDKLGTPQEAMKWYKPRLIEMKRLLKSTGSIYLQCDYRLVHYLKVLMDEVFGINNFQNDIIWNYGGQSRKTNISSKHDNILRYSKSNKFIYNTQYKPHTERSKKEYRHEHNGQMCARTKRGDKYYFSPLNPNGTNITDVWDDLYYLTPSSKERKNINYDTQKPKSLIQRIVKASSNPNDVVADFFMGSGTTGEVALELDRKFIGCDIGEKAFNITKERLQRFDIK